MSIFYAKSEIDIIRKSFDKKTCLTKMPLEFQRLKKAIIPQLTKDQLSKKWLETDNESLLQKSNL